MKKLVSNNLKTFILLILLNIFIILINPNGLFADPIVEDIDIEGLYSISKKEFLYLLGINKGDRINRDVVKEGIKRAFLKGIFEDISVEALGDEKTNVKIKVRERYLINNIYINGDYTLSKKTIRELFQIKEGDILRCEDFGKNIENLKREFTIRGYPNPEIQIHVEKNPKKKKANIYLQINANKPKLIKMIKIKGTDLDIKGNMKLSEGDVLNELQFKRDIDRITAYLKRRGYFKPSIKYHISDDGIIEINVNEGKRLEIYFHGNTLSTKKLYNEIPFFEAEEFNEDILEESVQRLIRLLHSKGYAFAQVAPVLKERDDLIELHYYIHEGNKIFVNDISFKGTHISKDSLKNIISLKESDLYNPDELDDDVQRLKDFYTALGYLSAEIIDVQTEFDKENQNVDIIISINEGKQTKIRNVEVKGISSTHRPNIYEIIKIKKDDIYNDNSIYEAKLRIIDYYLSKGFLDANISVYTEFHDGTADLIFNIEEGKEYSFGKTIITGNFKTKYAVIQRELESEENAVFDYKTLTKERQNLYKLGLFSDIEIETIDSYNNKKDILMRLKEGNAGSLELGIGYGEYERHRAMLDLSYRNLFGMNRHGSLRFELSSLEKRAILQYYDPWFLNFQLPFRAFLLTESKKEINIDTRETRYKLTRNTASAGFEKRISDSIKAELYYEFSFVNTYDVKPDVILSKEDTGTLIISGLRFGIFYDTRDNVFYPSKGILSGITTKITAPLFFSETNFIKLSIFWNMYKEIMSNLVLAGSLKGGFAQGYLRTNELPIVERFFLGGRSTVRGYDQDMLGPKGKDGNPIGGNVFLMESVELRSSLGKGIGLVAFLDGGNVWLDIKDVNPSDIKFTTGLGIRYKTPVGPLRIDYGIKLQKEKGESSGEIHFSIGHAF